MSNAYINIPATIIRYACLFFPLVVSASSGLLAPASFRGRRNRLTCNGWDRLPLYLRQNVRDRLRRLCRGDVYGHGEGRDINHGALPKQNRKPLFTMFCLVLHGRNEGSVKQFMIKWILDKVEIMSIYNALVSIRGSV